MDGFLGACVGFGVGLFVTMLMLECCETKYKNEFDLVEKHKTFEHKDKVYRVVIDTALTDSIHEWRK